MTKIGSILVTLFGVGWFCGAAFGATSPDIDQAGDLISEGDHAVAVERLSDIIREEQVSPQDMAEAYFLRGTAQQKLGLLGHSVADFTKAIWLMGEGSEMLADAHFHRGQVYSALRQLKRAIGDFDRAVELRSNFAQAYAARGDAYRDRGVHRLAIDDYGASIRYLNPDLHLPFYGRGLTYETMGRTQQAMADFRRAYELAPDFMPAREKLFDQTPTGSIEGPDALLADTSAADGNDGEEPTIVADATNDSVPSGSESTTDDSGAASTSASGQEPTPVETQDTPELRPTLVELPESDSQQPGAAAKEANAQEAKTTAETAVSVGANSTETSASIIAPDKVLAKEGTEAVPQETAPNAEAAAEVAAAASVASPETDTPIAETAAEVESTPTADEIVGASSPTPSAELAADDPAPTPAVEDSQQSAVNTVDSAIDVTDDDGSAPEAQAPDASVETVAVAEPVEEGLAPQGAASMTETIPDTSVQKENVAVNAEVPPGIAGSAATAASTSSSADSNVAAAQPAAPSAPAAIRRTGFFVQIASYRDEGEASLAFDRIAASHSEVLSGAGSDIARADLGSKGVYYRLRVGPYDSIGSSSTVCSQLKARNQDCLVIEEK